MSQAQSTPPVDPIQAAIALAQATAKAVVESQMAGTNVVPTAPAPAAVAVVRPGVPLSMADMSGMGGLSVDGWIGVNEHGLTAGPNKALATSDVLVDLDMSAIQPNISVKYGNNPPVYLKTYDQVMEVRGGPWADALARAQKASPGVREYKSCDLPFTVVDPIMLKKEVLAAAGTTVGHSLSTTNWKNWQSFYNAVLKAGLGNAVVRLKLESERRTGGGNTWGVMQFVLVGASPDA